MKSYGIVRATLEIKKRLEDALANASLPPNVFVGPLDDADAAGAELVLFLYRICPSATLRNREHRVTTTGTPPVIVYQNALPLDLYFLVTVGTKPGTSEEGPLGALGAALQSFQAVPELVGPGVSHEIVRLSLEPLSTEEASRIWALFPTANYRTSIAYCASPVWIDPDQAPVAAGPVVQDRLLAGSGSLVTS
jgi:hypothetical protein